VGRCDEGVVQEKVQFVKEARQGQLFINFQFVSFQFIKRF
jgi:hypothetical protein